MSEASAVVELLPRIATIPTRGNADTYRMTPERAREVRERLCHELLSVVPVSSLFPASVVPGVPEAYALLDKYDWHISQAQQRADALANMQDNASEPLQPEYSKNRRGMACGHVFRKGEPIFRCHDCSYDDTCVQCAMCYRHSIHALENHDVVFSVADDGDACCDCGDDEAWNADLGCEFHSLHPWNERGQEASTESNNASSEQTLDDIMAAVPDSVRHALSDFCAMLMAFLLETLLHAPKQTQIVIGPDVVDSIKRQPTYESAFPAKGKARLDGDDGQESPPLFVALLWNDEKHSFNEVSDKILEVCSSLTPKDARHFAEMVDRQGRQVVSMSEDVRRLVIMARRIGVIYLLVTVQHAFDYFVEEVAGCVLSFIAELASASLYNTSGPSPNGRAIKALITSTFCLLYTSDAADDTINV